MRRGGSWVALACAAAAILVGCGARTNPPPPPTPTPSSAAPTVSEPVVPAGARPFGLPVELGRASVVLRALKPFKPVPPVRGRDGTPVKVQVVINAPAGPALPVRAALHDPTTGLTCTEHGDPGAHYATTPGQTARIAVGFICPEMVQNPLLVTVTVGTAQQRFYGPLG